MSKSSHAHVAGPSQRQLRVGELVRRTLAEILSRGDLHDPLLGPAVTVGEARVSPDLKQATCFVMPLGGLDADAVIAALARHKGEIRHRLGRLTELRHVPDLRFRLDETFDRLDASRRMFSDARVRRDVEAEGASGDGEA